jgi:hypothetical protein
MIAQVEGNLNFERCRDIEDIGIYFHVFANDLGSKFCMLTLRFEARAVTGIAPAIPRSLGSSHGHRATTTRHAREEAILG